MDTSETYIKMRLAAIPDMGMGIPPLEPYHFKKAIPSYIETIWIDAKGDWYHSTKHEACQLERQDQLQKMVNLSPTYDNVMLVIDTINKIYPGWFSRDMLKTWEQIWLAFMYKEKYNKVWNGKEWIT